MSIIKVCGLTHEDDVDAAIAAGASALGFVFAASPRQVTPDKAARLAESVPTGVLRVAVMLHPSPTEWDVVREVFGPDVLQTDAADLPGLEGLANVTLWPVYRQRAAEPGSDSPSPGEAIVYEGPKSGTGTTVDWDRAATVAARHRTILAGGLGPDNVANAIERVRPFGVDASSSLESVPGRKDAARVSNYVRAARAALAANQPA